MEKPAVDWERIESDYRAGVRSLREIAADHPGTNHVAIARMAKRKGWTRDLSERIRAEADARVTRLAVTEDVTVERPNDKDVIAANAQAIVSVKLSHRKSISRKRSLADKLFAELEGQTDENGLFEQLGELMRSEDDKGVDKLNDLYKKVISLPQRIDGMKKLAETLKILIALEREAFDITPAPTPTDNALSSIAKAIQGNTFLPVASPVEGGDDGEDD